MPFEPIRPSEAIAPDDAINTGTDFERYFAESGKHASEWAIGAEVELFGFTEGGLERIAPEQVQAIIEGFSSETISRVVEDGYVTEAVLKPEGRRQKAAGSEENPADESLPAARRLLPTASGRLTLEPGGQVEFSIAHHRSLAEIERALVGFTTRLVEIGEANQVIFVAVGFDPLRKMEEQRWVPKQRYQIMRPYLGTRGRRAWDMMCRTAAIQVNLDYGDLEDLAKKFALANRLAPIAAAIFANSPFEEGKLSGFKSTRYRVWLETDPDRTGPSPPALEDGFTIERFVDYVSEVPMFFVRRAGRHIDFAGHSFGEYLAGCGCPTTPIFQDFTDHLSTIFTEARLKPHIEQRSMDCSSIDLTMASLAFWKGLMYDGDALEIALALAPQLNRGEYAQLQLEVARDGLQARFKGATVYSLAEAAIRLARAGLHRIAPDETRYLDALDQMILGERVSAADILIRNFEGSWHGQIRKAIDYLRVG
ncbi:MAG TPA: glutamate-cysteine ligase family protein [Blastocatellia bacterium]|nr:glutamate-cysteine ligase family protein [Blastocatellia bacterium]